MRTRLLGRTGVRVSELGFGGAPGGIANYTRAWNPRDPKSAVDFTEAVRRAVDLGYTMFDTAPAYGDGQGEELLGRGLAGRRDKVFLATKTAWRDQDDDSIMASLEASLRRLGTDHVDLLQIHGNYDDHFDQKDVERILGSVLGVYEKARAQGKARFLGVTSEYPYTLVPLIKSGRFDVVQLKYNVIYQDPFHHVLPLCEQFGVGVLAMRANTSGVLQKYFDLVARASTRDLDLNMIALNYVLSDHRVDSALVGMRSVRSVEAGARLSDDVSLRVDLDWLHERRADLVRPEWSPPPL